MATEHRRGRGAWLYSWVRLGSRRANRVIVSSLICLGLGVWLAGNLKIDSDFLGLLPRHNQAAQTFRQTIERFGSADVLLLGIPIPVDEGHAPDPEPYAEFADLLAERLRDSEQITWVEYRLRDFQAAAESLLDKFTLFLEPQELKWVLRRLEPDGMVAAVDSLEKKVRSPLSMAVKELLIKDPLGLAPLIQSKAGMDQLGAFFSGSEGYLLSPDQSMLLLLVKPNKPAADLPFSRSLIANLDQMRMDCLPDWQESEWGVAAPEVIYGGGYPIAAAEQDLIVSDFLTGGLTSLIGVILLFTLAFGRPIAMLVSGYPLLVGLALTFAFVASTVGRLNAATSAFAALLIGLGIDFMIVIYGRYLEERGSGIAHDGAIHAIGKHTARSVMIGAVTTAITFFAFLISGFKGLSELGLLTGTGILLLMGSVLILLPALLTKVARNQGTRPFRLFAFGLDRLTEVALKRARWVVAAGIVLSLALIPATLNITYDDDLLKMRSLDNPGLVAQNRIMKAFGTGFTPSLVRITGKNEAEVLAKIKSLTHKLKGLVDGERLTRVDSLLALFPDRQQQQQTIQRLKEIRLDHEAYLESFANELQQRGINPKPFIANLNPYLTALAIRQPVEIRDLMQGELQAILSRYWVHDAQSVDGLIYCYYPPGKWRGQPPTDLQAAIDSVPGAALTGPFIISQELKKVVRHDAVISLILGTVAVLLLIWWQMGHFGFALASLVPLIMGLIWTLGLMALAQVPVNFMNIFVFTMIIGIGVDYGVHLTHRWREGGGDPRSLAGTAKAIVVAALTTMLGFGSLALSHYPGLRSLGYVAILGALSTALFSITFLPALLTVILGNPSTKTDPAHENGLVETG